MERNETWVPVLGYEWYYHVSNLGRVWSDRRGSVLKEAIGHDGYRSVKLYVNGKGKGFFIHRLVANAFIPNPNNYPQINHKDEDSSNNRVENLEWCTIKYNANYGTRNARRVANTNFFSEKRVAQLNKIHEAKRKAVIQYTKDGKLVKTHVSATSAGEYIGGCNSGISMCANGKMPTYKGFVWRYENDGN